MSTETTNENNVKKVSLEELTSEQLKSTELRLELLNDNEYRLSSGFDILNEVLNPLRSDLSRLKLYIIAEDTCFDFGGFEYKNNKVYLNGVEKGLNDYIKIIDTYRHTYISAIYTKKYGEIFAKTITDGKEFKDIGNPLRDHIKDFNNNKIGRDIAKSIDNNLSFEETNKQIIEKITEAYNDPTKLINDENVIRPEHLERIDKVEWYIIRYRSKIGDLDIVEEMKQIISEFGTDYDATEIMKALTEPMQVNVINDLLKEAMKLGAYSYLNSLPFKLQTLFTEAEEAEVPRDPLLIDLDGDGIETTTVENGVYFDHESDGFAEKTAWVGKIQKAA